MADDNQQKNDGVLARHCGKLGHPIPFSYCMQAGMSEAGAARPCNKIIDCWWETFDIESFLKDTLTEAEYAALLHKEPGNRRAASLFDAIERALDNKDSEK